jgi:hypothetical protein
MTDPVNELAGDVYDAAMRRWILDGCRIPKPRAPLQTGRHIDTLPVEANPEASNLPERIQE